MSCKPELLPLSVWEGGRGTEGASFPASNPNGKLAQEKFLE